MKSLYIYCFILILALSGCKKYLDVNDDPSFPQAVKAEILLAPIIFQMANGYSQDMTVVNKLTQGIFGGSGDANSKFWERHDFRKESDVGGVMWRMVYFNHGHNLRLMIEDAIVNEKYEYAAIGYAVKAWGYQMLTDYHGPVILNDALKDTLRFSYNDQPEVYAKVRQWCDSAIFFLDKKSPLDYSANLASEKGDNLYRGNMDRWRRFVYGIKALQYGHLVNKANFKSQLADSVIKYVDLSFTSASDDAGVKFKGDESGNSNVFSFEYGVIGSGLNGGYYNRAGKPIVKYLTGGLRGTSPVDTTASMDPRLSRMLMFLPTDSTYIGGEPNVTNSNVPTVYGFLSSTNTYPGKFIFKQKVDFPLMTYAQLQLVKAEAQFIKGDLSGAYRSYLNGISGHMSFVSRYIDQASETVISQAEFNRYRDESGEIPKDFSDLKLSDIMGQKYIVQWGWGGLEQWCDLRKYNYSTDVFRQFIPLSGAQLTYNNSYMYRMRPRYNSEYIWNTPELERWGGTAADYVTKPTWFVLPD